MSVSLLQRISQFPSSKSFQHKYCNFIAINCDFKKLIKWGTRVAQSVERPISAQVMISQFVSSIPALGSVLIAGSLEPASESVSPSLSAPPPLNALCLSKMNKR